LFDKKGNKMIVKLIGKVDLYSNSSVHLDVNDVFYNIFCSKLLIDELKSSEKNVKCKIDLHIYDSIKESSRELFGFMTKEERDFFVYMVSLRGLGEKTVMNILSEVQASDLADMFYSNDLESLCKLPKIGRKTAEKILTEFNHKIEKCNLPKIKSSNYNQDVVNTAVGVLISLGVNAGIADDSTKDKYNIGMNVSELVSECLKK
jgi:Holliday junction DNA helicase RuvA